MPENERRGHEIRYRMARGFIEPGDTVVDAACGAGYGADILTNGLDIEYIGYDAFMPSKLKNQSRDNRKFIKQDLCEFEIAIDPDVFVGFETIEHLTDYTTYVKSAKKSRKWIIVSAPIIPTKHINPYHLHDFQYGDLVRLFADHEWEEYQTIQQPTEFSEISIFRRKNAPS